MNDLLYMIGLCSLWFFVGYLFFYTKEAVKDAKATTRLRKVFVYNDVVIRVYGHEGDPDAYRIAEGVSAFLEREGEADES